MLTGLTQDSDIFAGVCDPNQPQPDGEGGGDGDDDDEYSDEDSDEEDDGGHWGAAPSRSATGQAQATAPTSNAPIDDIFGTLKHVKHYDLSWSCLDESQVYKSRELSNIQLPGLPDSSVSKRAFDMSCVAQVNAIDQTT